MEKPKPDANALERFLTDVPDDAAKEECREVAAMMKKATGEQPKLWAGKMLGFGDYHYRYASGHEGDNFVVGFARPKKGFSIYLGCAALEVDDLLTQLGKHTMGKSCLYFRRLDDIDRAILKKLIAAAVKSTPADPVEAEPKPETKSKPASRTKRAK